MLLSGYSRVYKARLNRVLNYAPDRLAHHPQYSPRAELWRLVRAPSTSQAVALRARIILAAAQGISNQQIAKSLGVAENTVCKWRQRFRMFGMEGLANWGHGGRPRKYGPDVRQTLRRLMHRRPPSGERWTLDQLSRALSVPRSTVHEMLVARDFHSSHQPSRRRRG